MITSVAVLTIRKGHEKQVVEILQGYVAEAKAAKGCVKAYVKRAVNNEDTYLVYAEFDSMDNFNEANKDSGDSKDGGKVEFILRPHLLKGFYGNFE